MWLKDQEILAWQPHEEHNVITCKGVDDKMFESKASDNTVVDIVTAVC